MPEQLAHLCSALKARRAPTKEDLAHLTMERREQEARLNSVMREHPRRVKLEPQEHLH